MLKELAAQLDVDGHENGPSFLDGIEKHQEVKVIAGDYGHPISRIDPDTGETGCESAAGFLKFPKGAPIARRELAVFDIGSVGALLGKSVNQGTGACVGH